MNTEMKLALLFTIHGSSIKVQNVFVLRQIFNKCRVFIPFG